MKVLAAEKRAQSVGLCWLLKRCLCRGLAYAIHNQESLTAQDWTRKLQKHMTASKTALDCKP